MRKLTGSNVLFRPTPDVIMEFESIKKELKERVTLSPIDVSLPLHLYTDASIDGLSYFLTQEKETTDGDGNKVLDENGKKKITRTIIHIGSTSLTDAQSRYSPMELEMLCVQWSTQKLHYFLLGAPIIHLHTDSSGVIGVLKKHISDIQNPRLARMVEKLLPYILIPQHIKGTKNSIADS